jgi:hypothetical protein
MENLGSMNSGRFRRSQKNQIRLFPFLQNITQYIEVPPNTEAKRIISYVSAVLSCQPNPLLLKVESELLVLFRLLASNLLSHCYNPDHLTQDQLEG